MDIDYLLPTSWSDFDVKLQLLVAAELEESGYTTCILTPDERTQKKVPEYVTHSYNIETLADNRLYSTETIKERFEIPSVRHLCQTELTYYDLEYEQVLKRAKKTAVAVDELFNRHEFSYSFQHRGGELFRLLVHYKIRNRNGASVWNDFAPFENREAFSAELCGPWTNYETIPYDSIDEEDREATRSYIQTFQEKKRFYSHDSSVDDSSPIQKAWQRISTMVSPNQPRDLKKRLKKIVSHKLSRQINKFLIPSLEYSKRICNDRKYVYFPLQFPSESRLTIYSPEFYNQHWIIEYLSRVVPADVEVFVKQHPNHPGQQSPQWIHSLTQKPNVTFLHPECSSHGIIEQSEATIVTNNTVGFETLFYDTPLVVLGNAFYMDTPSVLKVDALDQLDKVVAKAIDSSVSDEDRIASIYSLKKATYSVPADVADDDWSTKMAKGLIDFVNYNHI